MNVSYDNTYSNVYRGIDLIITGNTSLVDCTTTGSLTADTAVVDNLSVTSLADIKKLSLTGTTSVSLVSAGGVQISKDLSVTGAISSGDATVTGELNANVVTLGNGTIGYLTVTNNGNTLSTTTGALVVTGGVGIGRDLRVGGVAYLPDLNSNDASIGTLTSNTIVANSTISASGNILTTGYVLGAAVYDSGRRVATLEDLNNYVAGDNIQITPYGVANPVQSYQISTSMTPTFTSVSITGTTMSFGTTTGALLVSGGIGVAGSIYATGMYVNNYPVLTTADIQNIQNYSAGSNINISQDGVISVVNAPTFTGMVTSETGFDASGNNIINVADPIGPLDAANKEYVDTIFENLGIDSTTFTLTGVPIVVCSSAPTMVQEWSIIDIGSYRVFFSVRYSATGNATVLLKQGNVVLGYSQMRCGPDEQMILSSVIPLMTTSVPNSSLSLWVSGPTTLGNDQHYQVTLQRAHVELQPIRSIQQLQTFALSESITLVGKEGTEAPVGSFALSAAISGKYRLSMSIEYSDLGVNKLLIRVNGTLIQSVKEHLSPSDLNSVSVYEEVIMSLPGPVVIDVSVVFGMSYRSVSIAQMFGEIRFIG